MSIAGQGMVAKGRKPRSRGRLKNDLKIERLRKRDGDYCYICGCLMRFGYRTKDGQKGRIDASIDHVVPWSLSYDNTMPNLKLAHEWCNNKKGALPLGPEVLRSICRTEMLTRRKNGLSILSTEVGLPYDSNQAN